MYTIAMFLGIYMNKFEMDLYLSKYGFNDMVNKVFLVVYATGIFIMILNVNAMTVEHGSTGILLSFHQECHEYRGYVVGFSVGWLITRGSVLMMYLTISKTLSDTYMLISKVPILVTSMLIVVLNLILRDDTYDDDYSSVKFLLAAALVEFLGFAVWQMYVVGTLLHPYIKHTMATVKVNINRQTTRTAAFGIVTLGVSVVELMTPVLHSSGVQHYLLLCLGFVIVLSLSMNFFDVIPTKGSEHALSISKLQGTAWMMMQPVLSYCVFGVGMIIKMLLAEDIEDTLQEQESDRTLGIFLGFASLLLVFIRLTHRTKFTMTRGRWITSGCRVVISIAHFFVGFYLGHPMHVHVAMFSHAALCASYVLIDAIKYSDKDILYLKIWSTQAREEEDSLSHVDSHSHHDEEESIQSSSHNSGVGKITESRPHHAGQNIVISRNLSEARILSTDAPREGGRIHIPRRLSSSSAIVGLNAASGGIEMSGSKIIQMQRRKSDGKISLPTRRPSEGKISLPRKPSEGKLQLTKRPSASKLQIAQQKKADGTIHLSGRTLSSSSYLSKLNSRSLSGESEGSGSRKQIVVKRRNSRIGDVPGGSKSPVMSPQGPIKISRRFKSSTDIQQVDAQTGQNRPPSGTVVKNEKGQFVLERMVETADGGTRIQHTLLHRVVAKKVKSPTGTTISTVSTSTDLNSIAVRRVQSTSNVSKNNFSFDSAKSALQMSDDENDTTDNGNDTQGANENFTRNDVGTLTKERLGPDNAVAKMSPSIRSLRTFDSFGTGTSKSSLNGSNDEGDGNNSAGSSVVLIDDDSAAATGSIPLTTLSRGASLTLTDTGRSDSFTLKETN